MDTGWSQTITVHSPEQEADIFCLLTDVPRQAVNSLKVDQSLQSPYPAPSPLSGIPYFEQMINGDTKCSKQDSHLEKVCRLVQELVFIKLTSIDHTK